MSTEAASDNLVLQALDFQPGCDACSTDRTERCDQPAKRAVWLSTSHCMHAKTFEVCCEYHYQVLIDVFTRGCHCMHCGEIFRLGNLRSVKL